MVFPGVAGSGHRRSILPGAVSLALHGGLVCLLIGFAGKYAVPSQPKIALTSVEIIHAAAQPPSPPPPTGPAPPTARAASASSAGARARREPVQHAQPSAPVAKQPLADLKVSYEDPRNFADHRAATQVDAASGDARSGIGAGIDHRLADGVASIEIPQPATVSLARSPRPKHDYRNLRIVGASKFAGETIKVLLNLDAQGQVRAVQLLQGVDRDLDRKTLALVRTFEYEPALDDAGVAIPGMARWDIQIVDDDGGDSLQTIR
jgi:hypothetical protein